MTDAFRHDGGSLADYRGSLTRSDGGEAVVLTPAWPHGQTVLYDASWRAVLAVAGPDARTWLNGMVSANVRDLTPGRHSPSFQLDPKGHILAMLDVVGLDGGAFLLLTDESERAELEARLRRYVFISKLTIEDRSEAWSALRLRGPAWSAAWSGAGLPELELEPGASAALRLEGEVGAVALASAPGGVPQLELLAPAPALRSVWQRLQAVSVSAGSAVQERDRILSRVPRYGMDVTAAELPQETGQLDRLDFAKGCYIGQEIVERIRARGAVHRHWLAYRFPQIVPAGAAVEVEGRAVGKLTSLAARGRDWFGLGYIREPHQTPGTAVTAGGVAGEVEA